MHDLRVLCTSVYKSIQVKLLVLLGKKNSTYEQTQPFNCDEMTNPILPLVAIPLAVKSPAMPIEVVVSPQLETQGNPPMVYMLKTYICF